MLIPAQCAGSGTVTFSWSTSTMIVVIPENCPPPSLVHGATRSDWDGWLSAVLSQKNEIQLYAPFANEIAWVFRSSAIMVSSWRGTAKGGGGVCCCQPVAARAGRVPL